MGSGGAVPITGATLGGCYFVEAELGANTTNTAALNEGQPTYYVPSGQATVGMGVSSGCNNFVGNNPGESPADVPIPYSIVSLNGSGDNPLNVYQPSSGEDYEYWQAVDNGASPWQACFGGSLTMGTSPGWFAGGYGRSATGISETNGQITNNDVYQAMLNYNASTSNFGHALLVELPNCEYGVWPAQRFDCGANTQSITGVTYSGETVTVTTATANSTFVGASVTIKSVVSTGTLAGLINNTQQTVTAIGSDSYSFVLGSAPSGSYTSGGTSLTASFSEGSYFTWAPGTTCSGNASIYENETTTCDSYMANLVFNTIAKYGMVASDYAGDLEIEIEQGSDWTAQGNANVTYGSTTGAPTVAAQQGIASYTSMSLLPWAQLVAVVPPNCPSNANPACPS